MTNQENAFIRTRFTYAAYTLMAFFGIGIVLPGAIMPFVSDKLGLTYGQTGMHFTANAAGAILVGLYGDRIANRAGNRLMCWLSAFLAAASLFVVVAGGTMAITLPALFFYGMGVGALSQFTTAAISDEHSRHNARVFSETNIISGSGVAVGPVLVAGLQQVGLGWQSIAVVMALVISGMFAVHHRVAFPTASASSADATSNKRPEPLPPLFWVFGFIVFLSVSIEWLLFYWSPDFLSTVVGFERSTAAALISVQAVAMVIGRVMGRRLLEMIAPGRLLILAFIWILLWFPVYLFSPYPLFNVVGLFGLGLGIANLFPLGLSGAMIAGGKQTGRASARITIFGSGALLIMPNFVGNLADYVSIRPAMLTVGVLTIIAIAVAVVANRMRTRTQQQHAL